MAYILQAFIVNKSAQNNLTDSYKNAVAVDIGHELALIPFTGELFDEINNHIQSALIGRFGSLRENIEAEVLKNIGNRKIAYVEADYFGGRGEQIVIIWEGKKRIYLSDPGGNEINKVLQNFGVIADKGSDEFDTLSLGRYKKTERWISGKV
jgi:hypothetical protein